MLSVSKAHAYGNDFLFVPAEQVEGLKLDELSRRLCERHSGIGGDGVIYYTIAPDGTAQMKLINTDGSPSELSATACAAWPRWSCIGASRRAAADHEVRVDTEPGGRRCR
jgi:diaminopimelate epimerase